MNSSNHCWCQAIDFRNGQTVLCKRTRQLHSNCYAARMDATAGRVLPKMRMRIEIIDFSVRAEVCSARHGLIQSLHHLQNSIAKPNPISSRDCHLQEPCWLCCTTCEVCVKTRRRGECRCRCRCRRWEQIAHSTFGYQYLDACCRCSPTKPVDL